MKLDEETGMCEFLLIGENAGSQEELERREYEPEADEELVYDSLGQKD